MENLDIVVLRTLKAWRDAGQRAMLTDPWSELGALHLAL
jgi:hypothetical protein